VLNRRDQIAPVSSSALVTVTAKSTLDAPTIYKTAYSVQNVSISTYAVGSVSTSTQYTVYRQQFSNSTVTTNVTQYFTIVPTNTTVFNSLGSASSLMQTVGQNDIVSYKAVVVADTEA
jgi:hypothetical protein